MVKTAVRAAKTAGHRVFRHAAVVMRGGAIVTVAENRNYIHAEDAAMRRLWPSERRGTTVLSIRVTKTGKLANAKPCPACENLLRENGVKKVIYSDRDGKLVRMKL